MEVVYDDGFEKLYHALASADYHSPPTLVVRALLGLRVDATWNVTADRKMEKGGTEWRALGLNSQRLAFVVARSDAEDWHASRDQDTAATVIAGVRPLSDVRGVDVVSVADLPSVYRISGKSDSWAVMWQIRLREEPDLVLMLPPYGVSRAHDRYGEIAKELVDQLS